MHISFHQAPQNTALNDIKIFDFIVYDNFECASYFSFIINGPKMSILLLLIFSIITISVHSFSEVSKEISINEDITHVHFSKDKIFYLSTTGKYFGFLSLLTGQSMVSYQLQKHEQVMMVEKQGGLVTLRSGRSKAMILDIQSLFIEEIDVEIKFTHQKILQVLKYAGKLYVLTDKDLRVYDFDEQRKGESLKNIVGSARKGENFKKIIIKSQGMEILLIKNDEVCLRNFRESKRGVDVCFFRTPYTITNVQQLKDFILIQTNQANYIIPPQSKEPYSFRGVITQTSNLFICLSDFKTYDVENQYFLDGLYVEGSVKNNLFWLHSSKSNQIITMHHNDSVIAQIRHDSLPLRSWVYPSEEDINLFSLLLQFPQNQFIMYEIQMLNEDIKAQIKWEKRGIKIALQQL